MISNETTMSRKSAQQHLAENGIAQSSCACVPVEQRIEEQLERLIALRAILRPHAEQDDVARAQLAHPPAPSVWRSASRPAASPRPARFASRIARHRALLASPTPGCARTRSRCPPASPRVSGWRSIQLARSAASRANRNRVFETPCDHVPGLSRPGARWRSRWSGSERSACRPPRRIRAAPPAPFASQAAGEFRRHAPGW